MKVTDTHMHFYDGAWPPGEYQGIRPEDLLRTMDAYGIESAWISSLTALVREPYAANEALYRFCEYAPRRLLPFYAVNPNYPLEDTLRELRYRAQHCRALGVKAHPMLGGFAPCTPQMLSIAELCVSLGLPMLFHDGTPVYCDPLQIAALCIELPNLKVILGHSGLSDLNRHAILAAQTHKNIYLCFCTTPPGEIEKTVCEVGADRLLFGTDFYGIEDFASYIDNALDAVRFSNIPQTAKNMILHENAQLFASNLNNG